jgi:Bacterial regulatory proteins, luxR family
VPGRRLRETLPAELGQRFAHLNGLERIGHLGDGEVGSRRGVLERRRGRPVKRGDRRGLLVSDGTVKTHVNRILRKLALRDRVQAVVFAYESGLVQPGGA